MWSKFSYILKQAENISGSFMLLSATVILVVNVILRYCFGLGISWAEEYIRYSLIAGAYLGASIAVREKSHVAMSLVLDTINNRIYTLIIMLVTAVFCVIIFYLGIKQHLFLLAMRQMSAAMVIPMYIPYLFITIGFFLMAFRTIENMVIFILKEFCGNHGKGATHKC